MIEQRTLPLSPPARADACGCARPLPQERADRKGAATTVCVRCGKPVPPRLR